MAKDEQLFLFDARVDSLASKKYIDQPRGTIETVPSSPSESTSRRIRNSLLCLGLPVSSQGSALDTWLLFSSKSMFGFVFHDASDFTGIPPRGSEVGEAPAQLHPQV